jgi:hypothetical protein
MAFPDLSLFPRVHPGPYERQMARRISALLALFAQSPDTESHQFLVFFVQSPEHWSAGHAVFDELRQRFLAAHGDKPRCAQYFFEECCAQALYNACDPPDPFDPSAAFFIAGAAFEFAALLGVSEVSVVRGICGTKV